MSTIRRRVQRVQIAHHWLVVECESQPRANKGDLAVLVRKALRAISTPSLRFRVHETQPVAITTKPHIIKTRS